jgi:molybdenum cofactor synthesis domain-containing protein
MNNNKIAAFIIIGDEILSGRTKDENLNFLAINLTKIGIDLNEVRVIKDNEDQIIKTITNLKSNYDYIFTSGGIGPTHDDITSSSIAKALNYQYVLNEEAKNILVNYYGSENINDARLKMAYLPKSAKLLENPISSAPGFIIENIFVFAGVPKIFQAMFKCSLKYLAAGNVIKSVEVKLSLVESQIAKHIYNLQQHYSNLKIDSDLKIGSYPFKNGTSVVFRSRNNQLLDNSVNDALIIFNKIQSNSIIEIIND